MPTPPTPSRRSHPAEDDDPLAAVVARIAGGDPAALRVAYDELAPRVLGLALRILRDRTAAEEAVVDVFAQLWRQAGRYDPQKGTVATWVATLARTRAIDVRRSRARHTTREAELSADATDVLRSPGPTPYEASAGNDRAERVQRALATLPQEQRRALEAAFFGGLSHTEIAAEFGHPLGTVKTRIRSGLVALRTALASNDGEVI